MTFGLIPLQNMHIYIYKPTISLAVCLFNQKQCSFQRKEWGKKRKKTYTQKGKKNTQS